jgi:MarR family transcriptional regulator, transcriptional regulator for hemolysin
MVFQQMYVGSIWRMGISVERTKGASDRPGCFSSDLVWLLKHTTHALSTELVCALAPLGVSPRGYHVLSAAVTGERTQTELAQLVGLDKTTMVVTIDELEAAGLVKRLPSPEDRRARIIAVTDAGEQKVVEGREIMDQVQAEVLATLPARERQGLLDALNRLISDRLAEPVECSPPVRRREPR